jgi:hypothetical protein
MANVSVIQRHAHLAGAVKLEYVNGREGKVAKAVLTAISNTRRGSGDTREEEVTLLRSENVRLRQALAEVELILVGLRGGIADNGDTLEAQP